MADENKLVFKTHDELSTFLMDLQGQLANLQETVDKMSPVEEEAVEEATEEATEEVSEEQVNEVDALLQGE